MAECTQQDYQLARRVLAGQIARRVRFGVAVVHRLAHCRRQRDALLQPAEHVRQRAREHGLETLDAVAGTLQVAQRGQQRQLRADGRAVVELRTAGRLRGRNRMGERPAGRRAELVRRDDIDAGGEPARILAGDFAAGAAIDDDLRMRRRACQRVQVGRRGGCREQVGDQRGRRAFAQCDHARRIRRGDDAQPQPAAQQRRPARLDQLQQAPADASGRADDGDIDHSCCSCRNRRHAEIS